MRVITELLQNRVLLAGLAAWAFAQLVKFILYAINEKEVDWARLFGGTGGMPSSHSASMSAVTISTGIRYGFDQPAFAICTIVTIIVMTDAAGVRQAAGRHAKLLNEIVKEMIEDGKGITNERMKELIGHTPLQVSVGCVIGILMALIIS